MSKAVSRSLTAILRLSGKLFTSFEEGKELATRVYFRSYSFPGADKREKFLGDEQLSYPGNWNAKKREKTKQIFPKILELIRNLGSGYWILSIEFDLGWLVLPGSTALQ